MFVGRHKEEKVRTLPKIKVQLVWHQLKLDINLRLKGAGLVDAGLGSVVEGRPGNKIQPVSLCGKNITYTQIQCSQKLCLMLKSAFCISVGS